MNKLNVYAEPGKQEIVITREFNAPRDRVFRAHTDPALVAKWWGPASMHVAIESLDARPGGLWRYIHRSDDGAEYIHFGVFHEVSAPERLIYTYELAGMGGGPGIVTLTLEERDGKTAITETSLYPSVEVRDAVVQSGMEGGAAESYDRMEELLNTLA
jgi:uncharacterized protein YndB with AHSA1/START domain